MSIETTLLSEYGGMQINSLNNVLNVDVTKDDNAIEIIKHSPYFDNEQLIKFCIERKSEFTILSLIIQSINAKFDQLQ